MAVEGRGEQREGESGVGHLRPGDRHVSERRLLRHHGDRTPADGLLDERAPVRPLAAERDKEMPRLDTAGVVGDARDDGRHRPRGSGHQQAGVAEHAVEFGPGHCVLGAAATRGDVRARVSRHTAPSLAGVPGSGS